MGCCYKAQEKGGLGVVNLDSANLALLTKWWQQLRSRYITRLFFFFIKLIHKIKLIDGKPLVKKSIKGVWLNTSKIDMELKVKDIFNFIVV